MNIQEVGRKAMESIYLARDTHRWRALVNAVMNLRVTYDAGKFLTSCRPLSFSERTPFRGGIWLVRLFLCLFVFCLVVTKMRI